MGTSTATKGPDAVETDIKTVRRLRRRIDRRNASQRADYEQRAEIFARLLDSGVKQAEIARQAGVTQMAVKFAVDEYRSKVATS